MNNQRFTPLTLPEDPFANFKNNIKNVKNAVELERLITQMGIYNFPKEAMVNPRYTRFLYEANTNKGLWNDPMVMASFLWSNKDAWKADNVSSVLEIGTFTGYGFFVVSEFMKAFVNPNMQFKTIDIAALDVNSPAYAHVKDYFQQSDSTQLNGEKYDLVLVDGSTEKEWVTKDLENTRSTAKYIYVVNNAATRDIKSKMQVLKTVHEVVPNRNDFIFSKQRDFRMAYTRVKSVEIDIA